MAGHVAAAVAWTGKVAVFWAGNMLAPPSPGGALYDPRTDTWRRIPVGPLGGREGYASVWTGREMLVIAGYEGQGMDRPVAAALNPATRTWRVLKGMEPLWGLSPNGAVWSGESVFVPGTLQLCPEQGVMCRRTRPIFLSYTPSTDRVREIGTAGAPFPSKRLARLIPLGWTGSAVVFWTRYEPSAGIVTYTPASGAWAVAPPAPCVLQGSGYEQAAWIDARVALPCGRIGLQIYDVATGRWQRVETGPSPLDGRDGSAVVWTGTDLIVWSGILDRPHNPAPNSGARIRLAS